jgi:RNA polymerase sigma factor (sigma-70 family)
MKPRQDLIEIFSTFLQFEEDNFSHWMSEPRLRRSMAKALHGTSVRKPEFWALFWHRSYRETSSRLARDHLWAYLEESRYNAATKVCLKYGHLFPKYTLADYCALASFQRVSQKDKDMSTVEKILTDFNPQLNNSLSSFAFAVFRHRLIDRLRWENQCVGQSQWSLLRHVSETMLREALNNFGVVDEATLECYLLAWDCFKEKYVPKGNIRKALSAPDEKTWEEIAVLYNSLREQDQIEADVEAIKEWMDICGKAIRHYLSPPIQSLNAPVSSVSASVSDENRVEVGDTLADEGGDLWENIFIQEGSKNINSVLLAAIAQLLSEQQLVLSLYYCEELSQAQIAQELEVNQATVSRRLQRARRVLLDTVTLWAEQQKLSLSSDFIYEISQHIEAWLVERYCWHLVRIFWIIIWLKASVKSAFKFKTVQFIYSGCF